MIDQAHVQNLKKKNTTSQKLIKSRSLISEEPLIRTNIIAASLTHDNTEHLKLSYVLIFFTKQ